MMNPRCKWVLIPIVIFFAGSIARAQEEKDSRRNFQIQIEKKIHIQVEKFILSQGLPGAWSVRWVPVGHRFGVGTTTAQDKSGTVTYTRTITGESRWLPDNVIEVTLSINENGVNRTETIRLQGFQSKTILLRKLPRNKREELRLIPEFLEPQIALASSQ